VSFEEKALTFLCAGKKLVGVLSRPAAVASRGVIVVVGGPQYRVGSHRQFLMLSRDLAAVGIPVLRFDYRGMGDSEGEMRSFESIDEDLAAAIDVFFAHLPELHEVILWGLCDAASAALMYAHRDPRVCGLVLANPWVRTPEGLAHTMIKHYYGARLLQGAFWRSLLRGRIDVAEACRDLGANLGALLRKQARHPSASASTPFQDRMALGLQRFTGNVLICLSGNDLTAREFEAATSASATWKDALDRPKLQWRRLAESNHTFSKRAWRDQVSSWTTDWMRSW